MSSGDVTSGMDATAAYRRNSAATTMTMSWPADVDLDVWYEAERNDVDDIVKDAMDLSVWSLETKRENVSVFLHCKNNEKLSYSVRAVAKVAGTVANVMECLRSTESPAFRSFQKLLHAKNFSDGEVLHAHHLNNLEMESLSLKWMTFWSQKTLGKGKEFCMREYCTTIPNHAKYGTVGVCKFESYDGIGARYGIRTKPDAYSLTVYEGSSYVVQQTPEDGMVSVTLTMSMRKARGEGKSSGVKLLAMRLALDLGYLQRAMQHTLFQPGALAEKTEWVNDGDRRNCSLCVQTFGMLKRRHHCRVCGEVVCSACTVFKQVSGEQDATKTIRVCKACLAKSATVDLGTINPTSSSITSTTSTSICSTVSSSDGSRSSNDDNGSVIQAPPLPVLSTYSHPYQLTHSKVSSSFNDFDMNPVPSSADSPPRQDKAQLLHPTLQKSLSTASSSRGNTPPGSSRSTRTESRRISYFNEDFEEICMLAMETLQCPMAGIRTEDFELVRYFDEKPAPGLPRSLPTFRRIASRGKPCIVLDVSSDKRISGEKRFAAKLQFFVGIPLLIDGEVIGDLCVADRYARDAIDFKQVEVLNVLGTTVTQYMQSHDYMEDLAMFKALRPGKSSSRQQQQQQGDAPPSNGQVKEVAF
uniref:FYVE-type domain-containing protein n=1 Tax=Globisporangium ultimum (strain ATCC 200006 / CBS 805.95 / DAOM BR144) TaxID=431595 RepID=K3X4G0_GLOUD